MTPVSLPSLIGRGDEQRGDDQPDGDAARHVHAQLAGRDRAEALGRVEPVGLGVGRVVQEVRAARGEAERHERDEGLEERVAFVEHAGGEWCREHQHVLGPLLGPGGLDDGAQPAIAAGERGLR